MPLSGRESLPLEKPSRAYMYSIDGTGTRCVPAQTELEDTNMALIRYEPWSLVNQLQNEINRLFDPRVLGERGEDSAATSDWIPAVDIREEPDRYVLHADVPGVDPKDIEITMENGVLTMQGSRVTESEEERKNYKRVERVRGAFYRRFTLPDTADAEKISARVVNGVLEVSIPKQEPARPRKIAVQT